LDEVGQVNTHVKTSHHIFIPVINQLTCIPLFGKDMSANLIVVNMATGEPTIYNLRGTLKG
jgi:hypothetical protein